MIRYKFTRSDVKKSLKYHDDRLVELNSLRCQQKQKRLFEAEQAPRTPYLRASISGTERSSD